MAYSCTLHARAQLQHGLVMVPTFCSLAGGGGAEGEAAPTIGLLLTELEQQLGQATALRKSHYHRQCSPQRQRATTSCYHFVAC